MDPIFKPFCAQISCIKFISDVSDPHQLFLVGSHMENNNSLTLMRHGIAADICDEPTVLSRAFHDSDVMDIQFNANHHRIVTSGSSGSLSIYKIDEENDMRLQLDVVWDGVCVGPISGCLFSDDRIISVSEEGEIVGLRLDTDASQANRGFEFSFSECAAIHAVEKIDSHCFMTANAFGQIKCWDVRASTKIPSWKNQRAGEIVPLHCLARHPGQPNIVASGSASNVYIWDLRATELGAPVQLNTGIEHNDIWRIRFHPTLPNHLFFAASCSGLIDISGKDSSFNWGDSDSGFNELTMRSVVGSDIVNMMSMDVSESLIVCGTDKEMLCLVPLGTL